MITTASQKLTRVPEMPNRYRDDIVLRSILERMLTKQALSWAEVVLDRIGELAAGELDRFAHEANSNPPSLKRRDPLGNRIDQVEFHPSYRKLMEASYGEGMVGHYFDPKVKQVLATQCETVKFAQGYIFSQSEQGMYYPVGLTDSAAYLIDKYGSPEQKKRYINRLCTMNLDQLWEGAVYLAEKSGGSDVGAAETVAKPVSNGLYALTGEKWFCNNINAELALVAARVDMTKEGTDGLGLFILRRHTKDGRLNNQRIERLKDKLGTRSIATGELTLDGAVAEPLGELAKGYLQLTDLLNLTRVYNMTASLGLVRRVYSEALRWARVRRTFGHPLFSRPMIRAALVDMVVELEASLQLLFYVVFLRERVQSERASEAEQGLLRVLTALGKYTSAQLAVTSASQALEIVGGNGYVEDWPMARFYRDAQALTLSEGATNILVLETFKAMRHQNGDQHLFDFIEHHGRDERLKTALTELKEAITAMDYGRSPLDTAWCRLWCDRATRIFQAVLLTSLAQDDRSKNVAEQYLLKHFAADRNGLMPQHTQHAVINFDSITRSEST